MTIGLITGSGLEDFGLNMQNTVRLDTEYGPVELQHGQAGTREVCLVRRHGAAHDIPPHRINYRANLRALRIVGCRVVIATNAVGSLRPVMRPGDLVLPDQFLDCTKARPTTFFDGEDGRVRHVDVTEPYCNVQRHQLLPVLERHGLTVHPAGTYICTEGPRFETPAEIRAYAAWGADVVGMTGVPEVVLARELGMCYATICLVTNFAAGISHGPITSEEIEEIAGQRRAALDGALREIALTVEDAPECACHQWW
jgi:5'-methylthioadenosine phosphorylase